MSNKTPKNTNYKSKKDKKKRLISLLLAIIMVLSTLIGIFQTVAISAFAEEYTYIQAPEPLFLYNNSGSKYLILNNGTNTSSAYRDYDKYQLKAQVDWKENGEWVSEKENWNDLSNYQYDIYNYNLADSYGCVELIKDNSPFNLKTLSEEIRIRYCLTGMIGDKENVVISDWSVPVDINNIEEYDFESGQIPSPVLYNLNSIDNKTYTVDCQNNDAMEIWYGLNHISLVQYFEYKINDNEWTNLCSVTVQKKNQSYELTLPNDILDTDALQFRSRYGVYSQETKEKRVSDWSETVSFRGISTEAGEYTPASQEAEFIEPQKAPVNENEIVDSEPSNNAENVHPEQKSKNIIAIISILAFATIVILLQARIKR